MLSATGWSLRGEPSNEHWSIVTAQSRYNGVRPMIKPAWTRSDTWDRAALVTV